MSLWIKIKNSKHIQANTKLNANDSYDNRAK